MQFQVPQFIEMEDKIVGPMTFRQFVYVAGGAGLAYLLWRLFPTFIGAPLALGAIGLGAALAFMQYNGRPLILALESGFYYFLRTKLYLWDTERKSKKKKEEIEAAAVAPQIPIPKLSDSKLHELAWSLDIKEKIAETRYAKPPQSFDGIMTMRKTMETSTQ